MIEVILEAYSKGRNGAGAGAEVAMMFWPEAFSATNGETGWFAVGVFMLVFAPIAALMLTIAVTVIAWEWRVSHPGDWSRATPLGRLALGTAVWTFAVFSLFSSLWFLGYLPFVLVLAFWEAVRRAARWRARAAT